MAQEKNSLPKAKAKKKSRRGDKGKRKRLRPLAAEMHVRVRLVHEADLPDLNGRRLPPRTQSGQALGQPLSPAGAWLRGHAHHRRVYYARYLERVSDGTEVGVGSPVLILQFGAQLAKL